MLMKRLGENRYGVPFAATVTNRKEHRGPKIAFYDIRDGLPGQMVSRYYLETLNRDHVRRGPDAGLNLDGGVPSWELSAEQLNRALAWANSYE